MDLNDNNKSGTNLILLKLAVGIEGSEPTRRKIKVKVKTFIPCNRSYVIFMNYQREYIKWIDFHKISSTIHNMQSAIQKGYFYSHAQYYQLCQSCLPLT